LFSCITLSIGCKEKPAGTFGTEEEQHDNTQALSDKTESPERTGSSGTMTEPENTGQQILTLETVLKNANDYNNKTITLKCFYYESTEKVVLVSSVKAHTSGWRTISPEQVWAIWAIVPPKDQLKKLNRLPGIGGEDDLYGEVIVEGTFNLAGSSGVGHWDEYKYSFTIQKLHVMQVQL